MIQFSACSGMTPRTGILLPEKIPEIAKKAGHSQVCLADHGILAGIPAFLEGCKTHDIPPVLGIQLEEGLLLARNQKGISLLFEHSELFHFAGSVKTTQTTQISKNSKENIPKAIANRDRESLFFLSFYPKENLEPDGIFAESALTGDKQQLEAIYAFAGKNALPIVAWAPWRCESRSEHSLLAVLEADKTGNSWEKSIAELERPEILKEEEFSQKFPDEFLQNALYFGSLCQAMPPKIHPDDLQPNYLAKGEDIIELTRRCQEEIGIRFRNNIPQEYSQRLATELEVIANSPFSGVFLAIADLCLWMKKQGILQGPGRGSAAGSLVSWLLDITKPDPIKENLFFERFINPERVSPPDFDIDVPRSLQKKIQERLINQWGEEKSLYVSERMLYKTQAGFKASARARGIPANVAHKETQRKKNEPDLPIPDRKLRECWKDGENLTEKFCTQALSMHPGAVALFPIPWKGTFPVYPPKSEEMPVPVLQYDHKQAEKFGAVKNDILSISTLDAIAAMRVLSGDSQDPWKLPTDPKQDPRAGEVFEMISQGKTYGVFQLGSVGITEACRETRPQNMEALIALIALYRPGPIKQLPTYTRRNRGDEDPIPAHPLMEDVLKETLGVMIYQEQAMKATVLLANFPASRADILRKAIGKKDRTLLPDLEKQFLEGCTQNNIQPEDAREIWSQLEAHADYSFNKSHACSYAWIAYATAWYKKFHPGAFFAAIAQDVIGGSDANKELSTIAAEMASLGMKFKPPCQEKKTSVFMPDPEDKNSILCPYDSIPGIGENLARKIEVAQGTQQEVLVHSGFYGKETTRSLNNLLHRPPRISRTPWNSIDYELDVKTIEKISEIAQKRDYCSLKKFLEIRRGNPDVTYLVPCMILERDYHRSNVRLLISDHEAAEHVSCSKELTRRIFQDNSLFLRILPGIPLVASLQRKIEGNHDYTYTLCSALQNLPDPKSLAPIVEIILNKTDRLEELKKILRRHQPGKARVVLRLEITGQEITEFALHGRFRTPVTLFEEIQKLDMKVNIK